VVKGPETGQRAPDFTLPWANRDAIGPEEQPFRLTDNLGKVVVLAFFARDFTPGSTAELQGLATVAESSGPEVVVVAISSDSLESHRRYASSLGLSFLLLSDPDQRVARRYGSDGADGVDRPAVYVIRPDGKVGYRDLGLEPQEKKEFVSLRKAVAKAAQQ
jgi:peroxiredoxin